MDADTRTFGLSAICIACLWSTCLCPLNNYQPELSNLFGSTCIFMNMNDAPATEKRSPTDAELVGVATAGDRDAFAQLYQRHGGRLLPTLWRLSGDRARAEDLLQDAFVQAWIKLDQLREPAAFGGWLKRLAVNLALADKRRLKPVDAAEIPEQAAAQPPWPAADMDLERAIARLPERARQVLVLFHVEGLAHEEIAALMKIEQGTSKAQLHRARNLLKEMLA